MRVLWTGTFDPEFSRNKKLARLMSLSAVHWRVVRENVWASDRVALASRPSLSGVEGAHRLRETAGTSADSARTRRTWSPTPVGSTCRSFVLWPR